MTLNSDSASMARVGGGSYTFTHESLRLAVQPPGKINGKNVLQHIDRLNSIESLALPDGIALSVHQNRLLKLAREGRKMSSRDLAKFTDVRRYASLVCVISEARATLTDEVIELHERILGSLFSRAKRTQAERLQQTGKLIQSKLKQYVTVGQALLNARESGEDPWAAIEDVLPWQEFINSVEETRFLSRKDNFDPLHLLTEKYSTGFYAEIPENSVTKAKAPQICMTLNE